MVLLSCVGLCCLFPVQVRAAEYVLDSENFENFEEVASDSDALIMPLASYGDVYDGSISSTVLTYMKGIVVRFSPTVHYVLFRESQYVYRLVYGENLEVSGSTFAGADCRFVRYDSRYYTVSEGYEGDFRLNVSSYTVYTDLESMYPVLYEGVSGNAGYSILFVVTILLLFDIIKAFFSSGRYVF